MPFERYLQPQSADESQSNSYYDDVPPNANTLQFQLPHFIYSEAPTLAPGGGAEVLPGSMLNNPCMTSWLTNNGFSARTSLLQSSTYQTYQTDPQELRHSQQISVPIRRRTPPSFEYSEIPQTQPEPPALVLAPNSAPGAYQPPEPSHQPMSSIIKPLSPQDFLSYGPSTPLNAPLHLGLPVYSASGFDLLSIMARVATRPHPKVVLGPVDLTCSFVVVDVRRFDHPIVYCSPSFCRLTGYSEREILGRNCRFLQAPNGAVVKGEIRQHTSHEAVVHLKRALVADKECQTSIVNYRKDGTPFINLVTVIPITGGVAGGPHEVNDVVYHVGFQVDLKEQPNAIMEKMRDGSYMVNYSSSIHPQGNNHTSRDRKVHHIPPSIISRELRALLADTAFVQSIPSLSVATLSSVCNEKADGQDNNQSLSLLLLASTPDFILVVSLKGSFLYVAPTIRRVLGYDPEDLVGKSITDYCHPADIVPLTRELKESSTIPGTSDSVQTSSAHSSTPRIVDLLFRVKAQNDAYVWLECRGRLHVEPGKGRKAIILSGRAREMMRISWANVFRGGGLSRSIRNTRATSTSEDGAVKVEVVEVDREFWGILNEGGVILSVGSGIEDVLGWGPMDMVGQNMMNLMAGADHMTLACLRRAQAQNSRTNDFPLRLRCGLRRKDSRLADVELIFYHPDILPISLTPAVSPSPTIFQVKLSGSYDERPGSLVHSASDDVFEELDTSRGSSWQYELQQLRFANQKLTDEISLLEAQQMQSQQTQQHSMQVCTQPTTSYDHQQQHELAGSQSWPSFYHGHANPLKRSWECGT